MVGPLRDEMVEDVAAILMTGWLTPWRFGDAAAFMSVQTHEKAVSGCLRTKLLFLLHLLLQLAYELFECGLRRGHSSIYCRRSTVCCMVSMLLHSYPHQGNML